MVIANRPPSSGGRCLLYFSPVPWESYAQRSHRFVEYFSKQQGCRVLWVQPYPTRLPNRGDIRSRRGKLNQKTPPLPQVERLPVPALPVEPVPGLGAVNRLFRRQAWKRIKAFMSAADELAVGIGKPSRLALQALEAMPRGNSFYDAMDNFPDFYAGISRCYMTRLERKIAVGADKLLVSSHAIRRRLENCNSRVELVHNACDVAAIPYQPRAKGGKHVFGYVGSIGHWFDWELFIRLAEAAPQSEFRLVGPIFEAPRMPLPKNVVLDGPKSHDEAVRIMTEFTVGIIPFKRNALTAGVDPIKYYEYVCAGLPVVSTAFGEMAFRGKRDGVFIISAEHDVQAVLESASGHVLTTDFVQGFRRLNDWSSRFQQVRPFD